MMTSPQARWMMTSPQEPQLPLLVQMKLLSQSKRKRGGDGDDLYLPPVLQVDPLFLLGISQSGSLQVLIDRSILFPFLRSM